MESGGWNVMGAMAALGAAAQGWRATVTLPNWAIYPILLVCAFFAQLVWGKTSDPQMFSQGMLEAWLIALGTNRIISDSAKGTVLETRRTQTPLLKN